MSDLRHFSLGCCLRNLYCNFACNLLLNLKITFDDGCVH
jgi:hypothetical protein